MAKSSFKGDPQDYLDWFTLGYEKENKVLIPGSTFEEKEPVIQEPAVPVYRRHDFGTSYAQAYIRQHNQSYKESVNFRNCLPSIPSTTVAEGLEDISTIADTDFEDDKIDLHSDAEKVQVYLHYDFTKYDEKSQKLPVNNWKKEILKKVELYSVIVIQGHTGCGKSTQVPQFILDDAVDKHQHVNVVVTQPRKIAAISLASRVCEERGWKIGKLVGYQVGLNNICELDTRLAYVTTEVLVQKVVHKRSLNEYTHIILDEIHERDQHMDFALLVVKKLLHTISKHVKIILMSATIDCEKFAKYFATPVGTHLIPAPIISIMDKTPHNVQVYYLESLKPAFVDKRTPPYDFDNPGISQEMFLLALNLISRFDDLERQQESKGEMHFPSNRGAVLTFLPGLHEIETMVDLLREESKEKRWETYPLHSTLTLDEQRSVFRKSRLGTRKIIVSTSIAESSITVPDIKYIIDFCLTKVLTCDPVTNYTSLKMAWTSKASCTQRAGRVGRVSSGRVYRLVEEFFFDDFEDHITPEMRRSPLNQVVLKIKQLDMGEPQALLALALDPPSLTEIYRTVLVLKQIGALGLRSGGNVCRADGDLTFLGRIAAALPLDPKLSKLIVMGYLFGCLKETVIIAAGLSLRSFHSSPFQDELNAFLSKVSWAHGSFSDCLAIYNTYLVWENYNLKGRFSPSGSQKEKEWARSSYVQFEALKEVAKLVEELNQRLDRLKITKKHDSSPQNREVQAFFIKISIAAAFYPNYFKRFVPDGYEMIICRELNNYDPFSTVVVSGLPADTNVFYEDQLKRIFKNCSSDLHINYEGSKAYIEFPKRKTHGNVDSERMREIPGEYPTAMYLALKMKQVHRIRQTLTLHLLSSDEANEQFKAAKADKEELSDLHKRGERDVQCSAASLKPPVMPPPVSLVWNLHVTYVENAGRFWAIPNDTKCSEEMSYIHYLIQLEMTNNSVPLAKKMIVPKMICLAPFTDQDNQYENYYRAQIEEIEEKNSSKILVYFVDYGNCEIVDVSSLRALPEGLLKIPMLAIPCVLSEVKPSSVGRGEAENLWSKDATAWVRERILFKEFEGQIYSVVHNVIRLQLHSYSDDSDPRTSINEQLIKKGFASKSEEFFLSKQNHELKAILRSKLRDGNLRSVPTLRSSLSTSSLNITSPKSFSTASKLNPRRLRGPYTPLEMTFVPLFRSGCLKGVKIDPTSVNSTALDLEPQSPHDRLIVAPFVDLNPSESHVILRNSTLMPALPGMLSLCLLMFSPYIELRVNEDESEYTGALFGLGSDPESGMAIYPDDDMEVAFDFKFTNEDLDKINSLRYLMSSTLERYDEMPTMNLLEVQRSMRGLALEILNDKREFVQPVTFDRAYRWNQVPESSILFPETGSGIEKNPNIVWCLHHGVSLQSRNSVKLLSLKLKALRKLESSLKAERRLSSSSIKETCPACNVQLSSYADLQVHLTLRTHLEREYRSYGLLNT